MKIHQVLAITAALAVLGAGCGRAPSPAASTLPTSQKASAPTTPAPPSPEDETIDQDIQQASMQDDTELRTEKQTSDEEVRQEQKTAIETTESEGVSF